MTRQDLINNYINNSNLNQNLEAYQDLTNALADRGTSPFDFIFESVSNMNVSNLALAQTLSELNEQLSNAGFENLNPGEIEKYSNPDLYPPSPTPRVSDWNEGAQSLFG